MNTGLGALLAILLAVAACLGGGAVVSPGTPSAPRVAPADILPPASPLAPAATVEPTGALGSAAPGTPTPTGAWEQLLASIPEPVRATCEQFTGFTDAYPPEPGELAEADCDTGDGAFGQYVSYTLFDSAASMDAFYDIQLLGTRNMGDVDGPGCFAGPGEGTLGSRAALLLPVHHRRCERALDARPAPCGGGRDR